VSQNELEERGAVSHAKLSQPTSLSSSTDSKEDEDDEDEE
jgi:hypothetical protein